ncbi:MAG TPA: GvpL/GvpF family gas vesicle protein [Ktedonobacterales bacterium]|nr:GvpL/GvpF family gas vesicle protein [Ktedonobacterales bacterium]
MQDSPDRPQAMGNLASPAPTGEDRGWYLYGITRGGPRARDEIGAQAAMEAPAETDSGGASVETIASGELLAIVRRVPLEDFSAEALTAHAEDPAWIAVVARRHNAIIERIHETRAILPAKFGCVYASADDVRAALDEERDGLLARLDWVDGCDEWGVRLYGDIATTRRRADTEAESVRRLREELASASPGRAYFLQRKLADELAGALDHLLDSLVAEAYERFAQHAKAGEISRRLASSRINPEEESAELMRAAFLVPRESADAFIGDLRGFSESQLGLWIEYSGPWPPYSFVAQIESLERAPTEEE